MCSVSIVEKEDTESNAERYESFRIRTSTQFLSSSFCWPSLGRIVSALVKTCKECQLSFRKGKHAVLGRQLVNGIFDSFSVDLCVPLILAKGGNRFINVGVEHLSRWLTARALPSQTAHVAVRFIVDSAVENFGSPRTLLWIKKQPLHQELGVMQYNEWEPNRDQQPCTYLRQMVEWQRW